MRTMILERTGLRVPGFAELSWNRLGFALAFIFDPEPDYGWPWMLHVHILWLNLFVHLPLPRISFDSRKYGEWKQYGVSVFKDYIAFNWAYKAKHKDWPWAYEHMRHEVLRSDGSWVPFVGCWERDKEPDRRKEENFSYAYILKSGEVQHRIAKVSVERLAWRQHWLRWTSWRELVRQSIDVEFDGEVGERTGSWKGGTIGCDYEMRPGETPERCLRRMEKERKF